MSNSNLSNKHRCAVPECPIWIAHNVAFCMKHWKLLPKPLQMEIWKAFRTDWRVWRKDARKGIAHSRQSYQSKDYLYAVQDGVDFIAQHKTEVANG